MGSSRVAILAGGTGSRLKSRAPTIAKPMVPILGVPLLEHLIMLCRRNGFSDIALLVHHRHETISSYFGDGSAFGVCISYCVERDARGTAGALFDAAVQLADDVLVLYGDTYAEVDLRALWTRHETSGADVTLVLHPNDHPYDSDVVEIDEQQNVKAIHGYPRSDGAKYPNVVNAAMYVIRMASLVGFVPESGIVDLAKHVFPAQLRGGYRLRGYLTPEYIKDMGTPDRLDKVERDVKAGLPDMLAHATQRAAIFFDRDGTLIREIPHLSDPSQVALIAGADTAVRSVNRSGYLAVVVTNQPVVARGDVTFEGLRDIHSELEHLLGVGGAHLDRIYFCPHHPDRGFSGEIPELKVVCNCRKPGTGMIDEAVSSLGISRIRSWMVGDTTADMLAGMRAGLRTILVRSGAAGADKKWPVYPDYVMPDVATAVAWALQGHRLMAGRCASVSFAAKDSRMVLVGGLARAGKSCVAQVLAEQLRSFGRTVHVLPLDGWLKTPESRVEGEMVWGRYQLAALTECIMSVVQSPLRRWLDVPVYDRQARSVQVSQRVSVGPEDILVVEGVPALLSAELCAAADVRVFTWIDENERRERMRVEYAWRGLDEGYVAAILAERDVDEHPFVLQSRENATHVVSGRSES
jgi:histidinol-phosphate phosphatase family protein